MSDPRNTRNGAKTEASRDEILIAASNGNPQALEFLRCFARRAHWVDDVHDKQGKDPSAVIASAEAEWLLCLTSNPFFVAHRAQLVPAMILGLNAWVDSNAIQMDEKPVVRDVVKGQWHEVVWLVAWLTGGWDRIRAVSSQFRAYDIEAAEDVKTGQGEKESATVQRCAQCGGEFFLGSVAYAKGLCSPGCADAFGWNRMPERTNGAVR